MRTVVNFNAKWAFTKQNDTLPTALPMNWNWVNLPHSWNDIDGQDGGNDYYRNTCWYAKSLDKMDLPKADRYYLELQGANASADVYVNGQKLAHHDGGYSTWRVDITDALERLGITEIEAQGLPFDPEVHNAVLHVEDETLGEGVVAEVLQKGYRRGDRVLRYAMVKVAN